MSDLSQLTPIQLGKRKNTLLRYKEIVLIYQEYKKLGLPTTVIWREHIYPRFYISKRTLYEALSTPIDRDLNKIFRIEAERSN